MKRELLLGAVFVFLIASCGQAGSPQDLGLAPDFKVQDLQGNTLSLADFRGKIVFLNFWATWCPPCRQEIPDLSDVFNQYKNKGLMIIGLSVDELSPAELTSFAVRNKISYPVAFATSTITEDYKPGQFIPTTFVIDKQGRVRHKQVGLMDKSTLMSIFEKLSKEQP
jgi:peroxiredoxin